MTISSATSKAGPYNGNGSTTAFAFAFKVFSSADIQVVLTDAATVDTTLTLTTDYTVSLNGDQDVSPGGTVTCLVAPATGYRLTILRNMTLTQGTDLPNQGAWYPSVVENALDKLTMITQQLDEKIGRAVLGSATAADGSQAYALIQQSVTDAQAAAAAAQTAASQAGFGNVTNDLNFTGTPPQRIKGDFSTSGSRVAIQTSTTNANTALPVLPNGTGTTSQVILHNSSDQSNAGRLRVTANATEHAIYADTIGTGTYLPMTFYTGGAERLRIDANGFISHGNATLKNAYTTGGTYRFIEGYGGGFTLVSTSTGTANLLFNRYVDSGGNGKVYQTGLTGAISFNNTVGIRFVADASQTTDSVATNTVRMDILSAGGVNFYTGVRENKTAVAASDIDLATGNYFTKTISGTTTFTVSNVPVSGTVAAFVLELTNGGSATVNWFSGVKWPSGTAPTLTAAGVDLISFYTHDGGTTWRGQVIAKDSK